MCDCLAKVDADMAERGFNTAVERPIIGPQKAMIRTVKADKKKRQKPAILFAAFCPVCGAKYDSTAEAGG